MCRPDRPSKMQSVAASALFKVGMVHVVLPKLVSERVDGVNGRIVKSMSGSLQWTRAKAPSMLLSPIDPDMCEPEDTTFLTIFLHFIISA